MGKLSGIGDGLLKWFDSTVLKDNRIYYLGAILVMIFFWVLIKR